MVKTVTLVHLKRRTKERGLGGTRNHDRGACRLISSVDDGEVGKSR